MLSETLKINIIKANDTKQAKENKSHDLIAQVHALSQWAMKFNVTKRLEDEFLVIGAEAGNTRDTTTTSDREEYKLEH